MDVILSFETPVPTITTQSNLPEDGTFHSHYRENLKSHLYTFQTVAPDSNVDTGDVQTHRETSDCISLHLFYQNRLINVNNITR
jgi:hypothetical protein